MVLENFKKILRMKQQDLKLTCLKYLLEKKYNIEYGDGYLYGEGDIPVMLVAHLDTVHREIPYQIYYDNEQDVMWSPQGIGGDDRCGIYSIMKILETYKPHVLFLEDEEKGCIGAGKAVERLYAPDVNFIIELDRRGINDCVFYDCGNKKFQEYIETFGFETKQGSFTDIVELSDAWQIASVNLSIGYFDEHTYSETIHIKLMEATINKVKNIIQDVIRHPEISYDYEPTTKIYDGYYQWWNKKEKELEEDKEEIVEEEEVKEDELQEEKK